MSVFDAFPSWGVLMEMAAATPPLLDVAAFFCGLSLTALAGSCLFCWGLPGWDWLDA